MVIPRLLTNPSLHANVLVRLLIGSPWWMTFFWRRLLITFHGMDVSRDVTIGPGLELPHPLSIVIGANTHIGSGVCVHHGISMSPAQARWRPGDEGEIVIGDGALLYPYAQVQADVGAGAVVATQAVVIRAVPEGVIVAGAPARVIRRADSAE